MVLAIRIHSDDSDVSKTVENSRKQLALGMGRSWAALGG